MPDQTPLAPPQPETLAGGTPIYEGLAQQYASAEAVPAQPGPDQVLEAAPERAIADARQRLEAAYAEMGTAQAPPKVVGVENHSTVAIPAEQGPAITSAFSSGAANAAREVTLARVATQQPTAGNGFSSLFGG